RSLAPPAWHGQEPFGQSCEPTRRHAGSPRGWAPCSSTGFRSPSTCLPVDSQTVVEGCPQGYPQDVHRSRERVHTWPALVHKRGPRPVYATPKGDTPTTRSWGLPTPQPLGVVLWAVDDAAVKTALE